MAVTFSAASGVSGDRWEHLSSNNNISYVTVKNTESSTKYVTSISVHMAVLASGYRVKNRSGTFWGNSGTTNLYATAAGKTSNTITISKTITSYDYDAEAGAAIYYTPSSMRSDEYKVTLTFSDPVLVNSNASVDFIFHFTETTNVLCWEGANSGAYITGTYSDGQYIVVFNGNGETGGSTSNQTFTIGVEQALRSNGFTKTGHSFAGWATSSTGAVAYSNGQSVNNLSTTNGATVNLYAKWTANKYTITLNKQDGTGGSNSVTATYGSAMPSATMPTRTGYTFGGYYTSTGGGGTQYYSSSGASARSWDRTVDTTLYAKWTGNSYRIIYDGNGNTGGSTTTTTATYPAARAVASCGFTRTGYSFNGWNTAANGTGTSYSVGYSYTAASDLTLYAQWKINSYTVTYDKNGGTSTPSQQTGDYNTQITLSGAISRNDSAVATYTITYNKNGHGSDTAAATATKYTTYTFSKWVSSINSAEYSASAKYTIPASNTTMTAKWSEGSRTTSVTLPTLTDTTNKYLFRGWSTSSTAISGSTGSYTPTGNVTLYAVWEENNLTITFSSNGGTGSIASITKIYGTVITLPSSGFSRTGYKFIGWNTNANGKGTKYALSKNNYTITSSLTLYAVWYENFAWTSNDSLYIKTGSPISYATAEKWNTLQNNIRTYVDSSYTVVTKIAGQVILASEVKTAATKLSVSSTEQNKIVKNNIIPASVFIALKDEVNSRATYLGTS